MHIQNPDRDEVDLYKNIGGAAESGWDFSSRWFQQPNNMGTIETNSILAVDLNCFLNKFEEILTEFSSILRKISEMEKYADLALKRKNAIHKFFFSDTTH